MAADIERRYIDGRFGQMHLYMARPETDAGRPPLVCFHMSPYSSVIYESFLAEMGKDRLAIAVDSPGFGNSDPTPQPPVIQDFGAAMDDVITTLGLETVDVMGFHTGSKVSLELARRRPDAVRRAVLASIAYWMPEEMAHREVIIKPKEINEAGSHLTEAWQGAVRWSMPERTSQMIGNVFYAQAINPAISHWGHQAAYQYDVEATMAEISQPILVLNPEDDLWDQTPRIKPLLTQEGSRFLDLPGWAHGFLDIKTVETAEIVRGFLDWEG